MMQAKTKLKRKNNWKTKTKTKQEALLLQRNRATRYVS